MLAQSHPEDMAKLIQNPPKSLQTPVWEPRQQSPAIGLRSVCRSGVAICESQRFVVIARFGSTI
eukprot:15467940-Alexandrium_andersonii.AAC.1